MIDKDMFTALPDLDTIEATGYYRVQPLNMLLTFNDWGDLKEWKFENPHGVSHIIVKDNKYWLRESCNGWWSSWTRVGC